LSAPAYINKRGWPIDCGGDTECVSAPSPLSGSRNGMYGPVQICVAFFIEASGRGFQATCAEIPEVHEVGPTETEAFGRARNAAIAHLRWVNASVGPIRGRPLYRAGSGASLETATGELLEAAYPGEGRKVRVEQLWI